MKRIALILILLAFALSPLMVSQANAAPVKHNVVPKHHRKMVVKKHAKRLVVRKHHRKTNA
jgi:hypothetical protein